MTELQTVTRGEALAEIPDAPDSLEFRALALDPRSTVYRSGRGLLLVDGGHEQVGVMGSVTPDDVAGLYRSRNLKCELLADEAAHDALRGAVTFEPANIFTLEGAWRIGGHRRTDVSIRALARADSLAHVPADLRAELDSAWAHVPVFAAFVGGVAFSFAYSSSTTESLADVSIDTLEAYRNRGIGAATAAKLIDWVVQNGKAPVWGAIESNAASLRLAEKLGFRRPAGRLFVAQRPYN